MNILPPSHDNANRTAILWALASQSVWLPVFFLGSQDQWSSKQKAYNSLLTTSDPQGIHRQPLFSSSKDDLQSLKIAPSPKANQERGNSGILLNSILSQQGSSLTGAFRSFTDRSSLNGTFGAVQPKHSSPQKSTLTISGEPPKIGFLSASRQGLSPTTLLQNLYSRSELLGGTLTLQDLTEPAMPPMARAERAQWSRSGDPLAPLPEIWREPMRRALMALSKESLKEKGDQAGDPKGNLDLDSARFVHIPSVRIRQASEIPLALQADGSVDILNKPDDPVVIDEIKRWSAKQTLPEKGKISPAVIHLHPMEPLKNAPLQAEKLSSSGSSQLGSAETTVPSPPAPEPSANSVPPAPSAVEESSSSNAIPPVSSAAPEPVSPPEPLSSSKVGS